MNCLFTLNNKVDIPFSNYWNVSGSAELIKEALKSIRSTEKISNLLEGGCVDFNCEDNFRIQDIKHNEDSLLSFMAYSGYLTKKERDIYQEAYKGITNRIPNNEILPLFYDTFLPIWIKRFQQIPNFYEMGYINIENCQGYEK